MTRTIYFDESGFTGYNLLDPSQPVFSVASADIVESESEAILRTSFPRYRGKEFHFSKIWRSSQKENLRRYCSYLPEFADLSHCYATNKRFAVLTKMMDFLVEPTVTDAGFDFYDEGFCWKYSNYVYFGLTNYAHPGLLESLLGHYHEFSKNPSPSTLSLLQWQLRVMATSIEEPTRTFIEQMALGAEIFEKHNDLESFRKTNNLQTSTMIAIVGNWRQSYPEDFIIIHDVSSVFLRDKRMWEAVTAVDESTTAIRNGDGSVTEWPLRVVSTEGRHSHESYSIQFCDILAGLVSKHFNPNLTPEDRVFIDELIDGGLKSISCNRLVPSTEFPIRIPPKRLDGPDSVDQMAEVIRKHLR